MEANLYREMASVQAHHWWFAARRQVLAAAIHRLALPSQADLLEIGCGTGGNLAMLSQFGTLQAVEYDDAARKTAAALGVCPVHPGGLPEPLPFTTEHFDLVCLLDVLEHIDDDQASLARVAGLLKPTGHLLVTVPAYSWLWSAHDTAHHHRRRYTARLLRRRAEAAGLTVARIGYFNSLLFPIIAAARLAQKLLSRKPSGSDVAMPSPPINRLLTHIFGFEQHIVPHALFPVGTSVMALLAPRS